jgi:biotin carboxyl carrier protein
MRDPAELLSAYFDESLSLEETVQLRAWLGADERNWRTFVRESVIHSRLRDVMLQHDMRSLVFDEAFVDTVDPDHIASLLDEEEAMEARRAQEAAEQERRAELAVARRAELLNLKTLPAEQPRVPQVLVYASVAAAAALLVLAFRTFAPSSIPAAPNSVERQAVVAAAPTLAEQPVIAELANAFDAVLVRDGQPVRTGDQLRPGRMVLERGVAQVKFASAVTMVVEAPAEVELLTADRAKLVRGRVVVRVPQQALGFTLHSDAAAFVDLGTEFGVEVLEPGRANVHVIEGEVAFVPGNGQNPSTTLRRGFANEVTVDGVVEEVDYDELKFVRRVPTSAYEWAVLKSRPLAYWRLDDVAPEAALFSEGKLGLRSTVRSGVSLVDNRTRGGASSGPARGARFVGQHEGVEVKAHEALGTIANCTYEAWVRPAEGTGPQRIISTFDRPQSGMAIGVVNAGWYQLPEDELRFQLTIYGRYDCLAVTPLKPNRWVHLAATVDAQGTPTLYVDGQEVDRRFRPVRALSNEPEKLLTDADVFLGDGADESDEAPRPWLAEQETPLGVPTAGAARLGRNPEGSDGKISPECWQGQLSNVAVYDRVLRPAEIRRHMEATRAKLTDDGSVPRAPAAKAGANL